MIDALHVEPWLAPVPYIVDDVEVCIVEEATKSVRTPTAAERLVLDAYFATPEARDEHGRVYAIHGEAMPGINGLVLTYPAHRPAT